MENTALTYLCPDCLAYLRYEGKEGKWVCDYCDGRFTREELEQWGLVLEKICRNTMHQTVFRNRRIP